MTYLSAFSFFSGSPGKPLNYDIITKENMIYKDDDYPPSTVTVNGVSFYKVHIGEKKKEKKKASISPQTARNTA